MKGEIKAEEITTSRPLGVGEITECKENAQYS